MTKLINQRLFVGVLCIASSIFAMDRNLDQKIKYEKMTLTDAQASQTDDKKSVATQTYPSFGCKRTLGVTQTVNLETECLCDPCISVRCKIRESDRKICWTSLAPLCCACCLGGLIVSCLGK